MSFNWKSLIPVLETMGNVTEMAIPGAAAFIPLTQAAENAVNPILLKIGTGQSVDVQTEVMAFYATVLAGWNLAKQKTGLDAASIAKIDANIKSATDSMNAYFAAGVQFDQSEFTPVTPIVVPPPVAPTSA